MGFEYGELGCFHDTRGDEVESEVFFLSIRMLWLDGPADEFLDLRNEPDEHKDVGDVEGGVERGEHH